MNCLIKNALLCANLEEGEKCEKQGHLEEELVDVKLDRSAGRGVASAPALQRSRALPR